MKVTFQGEKKVICITPKGPSNHFVVVFPSFLKKFHFLDHCGLQDPPKNKNNQDVVNFWINIFNLLIYHQTQKCSHFEILSLRYTFPYLIAEFFQWPKQNFKSKHLLNTMDK